MKATVLPFYYRFETCHPPRRSNSRALSSSWQGASETRAYSDKDEAGLGRATARADAA